MTITLKNVTKRYPGGERDALTEVSLEIASREFFVLVGPSGGGKTTLLKMLNRLIEPSSGEILIDGEDIRQMHLRQLRLDTGYVLQQGALFPNLTVAENIGLIPGMKGATKEEQERLATELLPRVGLDPAEYLTRMPAELSGGEAQRIGILRAIASNPKIILMDEPFSALDPISRKQLQALAKQLQRDFQITTVFVTHDMSEAMALADHIAVFGDGKLQQVGSPSEIYEQPANAFVAQFFEDFQQNLTDFTLGDLEKVAEGLSAETQLTEVVRKLKK